MAFIFILPGMFLMAYAILMGYAWRGWKRVPVFRHQNGTIAKTISIIIAARNEGNNIGACLESILDQDFPVDHVEVIVVDDYSDDDTVEVVKGYMHKGIKITILLAGQHDGQGKKAALKRGIATAVHECIVTTDADCCFPPHWLKTLSEFQASTDAIFVAAPVSIGSASNLLECFQSLDFLTLQGITAVAVHHRWFNMCNGANLMYTREAFHAVHGFDGIDHLASGDDMLLMEKINEAYPGRVHYCLSQEAVVETAPVAHWRGFLQQRIRWASKSTQYQSVNIKLVLLLVYLLNVSLTVLLISSFFYAKLMPPTVCCFLMKCAVEWPFMSAVAGFYGRKKLMWWFLPMQPLHALYTMIAGGFGLISSYEWKGRKVRQ